MKKKDAEGELGMICAQMPVVHVVQRNIKARIADTPLILVNFFLRAQNAKNLLFTIRSMMEKWCNNQYIWWWFSKNFTNRRCSSKLGNPSFFSFSLSFLGNFLCFLLYSHNHDNRAYLVGVSQTHDVIPMFEVKIRSLRLRKRPEIVPRRWENDKKMMSQ